jgi:hypothetical protein
MTDNRKKILEMLDAKKITVEESMKLLQAVENSDKTPPEAGSAEKLAGMVTRRIKYLRVLVDSPRGHHGEGAERVNVRVPISLIRAGMKFTSLIPKEAGDKIEEELKAKGINFNIKNIKDEDVDELIEALAELEVDIDGGDGKVKIFAE